MSGNSTSLTLVIGICESSMGDLHCRQLAASYLERSLLIWMMLLHLHVTFKMPMMINVYMQRTYDTVGDICPLFERLELCFKAAVTILVW